MSDEVSEYCLDWDELAENCSKERGWDSNGGTYSNHAVSCVNRKFKTFLDFKH